MQSEVVSLDGRASHLVLATTWRARMRGLAHTDRSAWTGYDGMLLRFSFAARWPIWMRGMRFPITTLWLRRGAIVDRQGPHDPQRPWRLILPKKAVDAVVELFVGNTT